MTSDPIELWEVLVPTVYRQETKPDGSVKYYTTRYHRTWDARVQEITGGLTIFPPVRGRWIAPDGDLYAERSIPVRIACTREQVDRILKFTAIMYDQLAVMAYKISEEVLVHSRGENSLADVR